MPAAYRASAFPQIADVGSQDCVRSGGTRRSAANVCDRLQQTGRPEAPADWRGDSDIALHSMSDRTEGSASATEKPTSTGFVILRLQLRLKSMSG